MASSTCFFLSPEILSPSSFNLLLALISKVIGVVLDLDRFLRLLVFLGVGFGFALHLLDLFFRKSGAAGDGNLLFLAGPQIFRRYVQNAVGVDIECHFNLRNAARRWRNSIEMECAERSCCRAKAAARLGAL